MKKLLLVMVLLFLNSHNPTKSNNYTDGTEEEAPKGQGVSGLKGVNTQAQDDPSRLRSMQNFRQFRNNYYAPSREYLGLENPEVGKSKYDEKIAFDSELADINEHRAQTQSLYDQTNIGLMVLIVASILAVSLLYFHNKHQKHIETKTPQKRAAPFGGMREKYSQLVLFMEQSNAHLTKQTKDSLVFSTQNGQWWIDIVGSNVEIRHKAVVPYLGKISKKWSYSDSYPQELVIQDLLNYSQSLFIQMSEAANR